MSSLRFFKYLWSNWYSPVLEGPDEWLDLLLLRNLTGDLVRNWGTAMMLLVTPFGRPLPLFTGILLLSETSIDALEDMNYISKVFRLWSARLKPPTHMSLSGNHSNRKYQLSLSLKYSEIKTHTTTLISWGGCLWSNSTTILWIIPAHQVSEQGPGDSTWGSNAIPAIADCNIAACSSAGPSGKVPHKPGICCSFAQWYQSTIYSINNHWIDHTQEKSLLYVCGSSTFTPIMDDLWLGSRDLQ